ncbi:hypothetical protein CCHR01_16058 [Colletotrichum chrysophilum]|uniref:Uncharacterized protein n=1 Tax=Colletotrichum chrysophilum TaxID=1836956 RepID=A0AAD9EB70_9PEZI|nr:hypothetical protein CCHR01_16058 [Colletotrichum chrysophilum]
MPEKVRRGKMGKIRCFGAPNAEAHVLSHISHSLSDQDKSGRPSGRRYARDRQLAREKQRRKTCVGARKEDAEWPAARTTPPPRARRAVRAAMGTNGHCGTFSGARTAESETSNGLADNSWLWRAYFDVRDNIHVMDSEMRTSPRRHGQVLQGNPIHANQGTEGILAGALAEDSRRSRWKHVGRGIAALRCNAQGAPILVLLVLALALALLVLVLPGSTSSSWLRATG